MACSPCHSAAATQPYADAISPSCLPPLCSTAPFPPYGSCTKPRTRRAYECATWRSSAKDISDALKKGAQQLRFDIAVVMASNT